VTPENNRMALPFALPRYDFIRAGRALAALLKDPDDLPQVFTMIESLSGTSPHRLLAGFKRSETGRRLLRDKPDIVPILANREALRALPAGSLGRAYLDFVESEGISPEGIRTASEVGRPERGWDERFAFVGDRMRDTHDLWHAATGYRGDVLGELSLLAFNLAQNWNTAIALIVVAGILKGFGSHDIGLVVDGFRRGQRAAWLPAQDWESLLPLPVEKVREMLKLEAPAEYTPLRTTELRAQGLVLGLTRGRGRRAARGTRSTRSDRS
jgi:ubiquinone biosynthesis protein COQ4